MSYCACIVKGASREKKDMRKLIFHIGDKKTGSTSIQQALLRNMWVCKTCRLEYLIDADAPYHHHLAWLMTQPQKTVEIRSLFGRLSRRIRKSDADVGIVSSELFREVPPSVLRQAIDRFLPQYADQVEILIYIRPHADRLLSLYGQEVKLGSFLGFPYDYYELTLKRGDFRYFDLLHQWQKTFGDQLTVRPMVKEHLFAGGVVSDFLHSVLAGAPFELAELANANPSLSAQELSLIRRFHLNLAEELAGCQSQALKTARMRTGERLAEHFSAIVTPAMPTDPLRLDRALASRVLDSYAQDATQIDAAWFQGAPMQRALEKTVEMAPLRVAPLVARSHFPPITLRLLKIWARLAGEMIRHDPDGWSAHVVALVNGDMRGLSPGLTAP